MWTVMTRLAWLCGIAATLGACGGDDVVNAEPAPAVAAVIGPQGGTVDGPDGVLVVIPAGALVQATTIGIARSSVGAPTPPTDNPAAGAIYEFTPHDLVFNAPVTLRMPVPASAASAEVFMASPGEGWQANSVVTTDGSRHGSATASRGACWVLPAPSRRAAPTRTNRELQALAARWAKA